MISARVYKAQLDEALVAPAHRRLAEAWLAQAVDFGQKQINLRRTSAADRLKAAMAQSVNSAELAEAVVATMQQGKMDPATAMQHLRELEGLAATAESVLPQVQEQLALANAADPLSEFDALMIRFPAMAKRVAPAPPLE